MSEYIHKSHNVSVLMYHFVCPAKYRRAIFSDAVTKTMVEVCQEISERFEIYFLEIGTDKNHVHFLIQSIPRYSPTEIINFPAASSGVLMGIRRDERPKGRGIYPEGIKKVKSITARQIFAKHPEVKKQLWGGEIWTDGYFVNTVSKYGSEMGIKNYLQNQGRSADEYISLHKADDIEQLTLF